MKNVFVPIDFLLRWRFEFADGSAKYGMWNNPGTREDLTTKAYAVNLDKAVRAQIEGTTYDRRIIKIFAECPIDNFLRFEWVSVNPVDITKKFQISRANPVGLKLVKKDGSKAIVYCNGKDKAKWQ